MQNQEKIVQMFDEIAPSYDKANRILSFGVDISWRKKACKKVLSCFNDEGFKFAKTGLKIADIACGTGDMINFWQEESLKMAKKVAKITGVDPSENMLKIAKEKVKNAEFIQASATNLPFKDGELDILSISYGIRNVLERKKAWLEFYRVLKKDGILLVLEFSKTSNTGFIGHLRQFYLHFILPKLGGFISKNKSAYEYLPNSIEHFISKDEFIAELREAGFEMMYYEGFSFDISSMFIAKK